MGAPLGETGRGTSSPGTSRDRLKKALETERLFLLEHCEGNLELGLIYWALIQICKRRLWKWNIFLYVGAS
jgi:hypothetical protein